MRTHFPTPWETQRSYDAATAARRNNPTTSLLIPLRPIRDIRAQLEAALGSNESGKYLGDVCRPTSQVQLVLPESNTSSTTTTSWILQTFDEDGQAKTQGGDEFYVTFIDASEVNQPDPTAVALVNDRNDGSYALDFVTTPSKRFLNSQRKRRGTIHVYFQYTCGMGQIHPPTKETWQSGGRLIDLYYYSTPVHAEPPMRIFQPPQQYNLSAYSVVFLVGDSLFQQLARDDRHHAYRPYTYMTLPIQRDLHMGTLDGNFLAHVEKWHGREFRDRRQPGSLVGQNYTMAVIIGSFVWDILASTQWNISSHLAACRLYVQEMQQRYPLVQVFWKSGTAMHVHRLPANCTDMPFCNIRTRYMSSSRAELLYQQQKQLMKSLQVPFLDLYEASYLSAHQSRPGDGRHYTEEWNKQMSEFLFGIA